MITGVLSRLEARRPTPERQRTVQSGFGVALARSSPPPVVPSPDRRHNAVGPQHAELPESFPAEKQQTRCGRPVHFPQWRTSAMASLDYPEDRPQEKGSVVGAHDLDVYPGELRPEPAAGSRHKVILCVA